MEYPVLTRIAGDRQFYLQDHRDDQLDEFGLGAVVPVVELVDWATRGGGSADLVQPMLHTLTLGVCGALFVIVLAIGTAWTAARGRSRVAGWMDHGVFLVSAIPGILLAFGQ